jgi:hypothetical protein
MSFASSFSVEKVVDRSVPAGTCASTVPGFASPAKAPTPQQLLLHSRRKSSQLHAISSWFHLLLWLYLQVGHHSRTDCGRGSPDQAEDLATKGLTQFQPQDVFASAPRYVLDRARPVEVDSVGAQRDA